MSEFNLDKATQAFWKTLSSLFKSTDTIEKVSVDLKNVPEQIQNFLQPPRIHMNADELKKRSVDDLYRQVKQKIVEHRFDCQISHSLFDISDKLIECVIEKLEDEGFDVEIEKMDNQVQIRVKW